MELKATNKGKMNLPFAVNERRLLTIRAERVAPKYLIDGKLPKVDAQQVQIERYPTHIARYYRITIGKQSMKINVQVNDGNPADDEAMLAEITEELLSDNFVERENEHHSLHR